MNILKKRGPYALLVILFTFILTGCMPGVGATNTGWTVLTAEDDVVYTVLSTGTVVALDATNLGAELWRYPIQQASGGGGLGGLFGGSRNTNTERPLQAVYGPPAVTDDLVLATTFDGMVYAFDRETGRVLWTLSAGDAIIGSVTLYDDIVYYGSSDHNVYAVDAATREPVWDEPFATENWVWGAPAVDETRVYVGSMDRHVYAIDRATGREVWRFDVGASVPGDLTLSNGVLFVGGVDSRMRALDKETGRELWRTEDLGGWVWGEALVHEDYVYFGSLNGLVHARRVSDGDLRWMPAEVEGVLRAGPAMLDDKHIIVGTNAGSIYAIQMEEGSQELIYNAGGAAVLSTPAVEGSAIYVGTAAGNVYALDLNRRDPILWTYPADIR